MELVGDSLIQLGVIGNVADGTISVTSSKKRRSQLVGSGAYRSLSSVDWGDEHQRFVNQVGDKVGLMEEKLVLRLDQQQQFKEVSNLLVGEVKGSIQSLNLNQARQKAGAENQQSQMTALIEQTRKLIAHRIDSSRGLGNQQNVFSQQFVQMEQWQSDVEQEILTGSTCRKDLASHAQTKQMENKFIKEALQAMKAQNRNRTSNPIVHGESTIAFGGESKIADGAG